MTRGIWGDDERYLETYWRRFPGVWTHGDWASIDEDGYWFLHGRSDDTLNIAGKRIGPAELESAALDHPSVAEAAAIGVPHEVKGETAWIFCRAEARRRGGRRRDQGRGRRRRSARRSRPSASSSSRPCRRRAPRRSSAARCARRRSARTPATSRRSRTPTSWRRSQMPSRALVTGGGRGIGAGHRPRAGKRRLARDRDRRSSEQVDEVAARDRRHRGRRRRLEARGRRADDRRGRADRPARRERRHRPLGGVLGDGPGRVVAHLRGQRPRRLPHLPPRAPGDDRARRRQDRDHRQRRVLPARLDLGAYSASKAAVGRYGEMLAKQVEPHGVKVFVISPGLVNTDMTGDQFPDDAPWTPPELAPRLVARARLGPLRRPLRPLPPRRARPARRARVADRPDPGRGSERDPAQPREPERLGGLRLRSRSGGRPRAARLRPRRAPCRRRACGRPRRAARRRRRTVSPSSGRRTISAAIRPSTISPRPGPPTAQAPGQSIAAQTTSGETSVAVHGAAWRFVPATGPTWMQRPSSGRMPQLKHSAKFSPLRWTWRGGSLLGLGERRRRRRLERGALGPRLGDERLAVEQAHEAVLADDGERPVERRRQAERHLRRSSRRTQRAARRVAAVPRLERDRGSGGRS